MMAWLKTFSCGSGSYGATLLRLWLCFLLCYEWLDHFHKLTGFLHPQWTSFSGLQALSLIVFEGLAVLLLFFGLFVRLACSIALVLVLDDLYAYWGMWNGDFEAALAFFFITLAILFEGAGEYSVDQLIKK
jgi:uncharacterized membrane protein YphA (DoxX/SURF4 family)